jgi:hypothetical protein
VSSGTISATFPQYLKLGHYRFLHSKFIIHKPSYHSTLHSQLLAASLNKQRNFLYKQRCHVRTTPCDDANLLWMISINIGLNVTCAFHLFSYIMNKEVGILVLVLGVLSVCAQNSDGKCKYFYTLLQCQQNITVSVIKLNLHICACNQLLISIGLTKFVARSPSWEANSLSTGQEIPYIWDLMFWRL